MIIDPCFPEDSSWHNCRVEQPATCLTADIRLTADPGVAILIPARSHTFVEVYYEIIPKAIILPSADSRKVFVSYKRKNEYMHEVLANC